MYQIQWTKKSIKFLEKHLELKPKIIDTIKDIANDPFSSISKYDIKKLKGIDDFFRLRISKYRVVYTIIDQKLVIIVLDIDSRGDIYKNLKE